MLGWVIVNYWLQPAYYRFSSLAGSKDWFLLEHNHNWPKVLNLCIPTTIYVCWFVFRLLWAKISRKVGNNWWYWSVTWVMVSTHQMRGDSSAQTVTPHYKLPFCSAIFKVFWMNQITSYWERIPCSHPFIHSPSIPHHPCLSGRHLGSRKSDFDVYHNLNPI